MNIATTLKENWAVICAAPLAFLISVAVTGSVIWTIIWHLKADQVSTLEARLKLRDDEITGINGKLIAAQAAASQPAEDARQVRRRAIIAEGRRQIAEFNSQTDHRHLVDYLSRQEEWPAIRATLDPKVLRYIENGRMAVLTDGSEKDGKVHYVLRELDRLEREWDLV